MSRGLGLQQFVVCCERKIKTKCEVCNSSFKFGKLEHICKRCSRSVCDDCSPYKVKCYMPDYKNAPHRMCRKCHVESEHLNKYVKTNHLKWGEDSDLVKLWLKKLGLKSLPKKRISDKTQNKEAITFMQVWKSLNFSFRQFLGIVIDEAKVSQGEVTELINLTVTQLSNSKIANIQHSIYILLFFLAHSSAHYAVYFTTVVLQVIYTQDMSMDNIHYFLEQMNCVEIEIYKMETMIEQSFQRMFKRCSINVFTAEVSIEIVNNLISLREVEELEKGIAYVFSERKEFICLNSNKPMDVYLDILRNLSCTNFRKIIRSVNNNNSPDSKSVSDSERSDKLSNKSGISSSKFEHLKRQNEEMKSLVRNQEMEILQLKKENEQLRKLKLKKAPQLEKKSGSANFLSHNENSIFRETVDMRGNGDSESINSSDYDDKGNGYNEIINKKNEEIISLKKDIENLNMKVRESDAQSTKNMSESEGESIRMITKKNTKQKQEIEKLKQENRSLNETNKNMLLKLHQLGNLLMDKQQKSIQNFNQDFNQISKLSKDQINNLQKQCNIF